MFSPSSPSGWVPSYRWSGLLKNWYLMIQYSAWDVVTIESIGLSAVILVIRVTRETGAFSKKTCHTLIMYKVQYICSRRHWIHQAECHHIGDHGCWRIVCMSFRRNGYSPSTQYLRGLNWISLELLSWVDISWNKHHHSVSIGRHGLSPSSTSCWVELGVSEVIAGLVAFIGVFSRVGRVGRVGSLIIYSLACIIYICQKA